MNSPDKLDRAIAELDHELSPKRDLWPGIENAILPEPKRALTTWAARAAGVMSLALIGWIATHTISPEPAQQDWLAKFNQDHQQQKNQLLVKYQDNQPLAENWEVQMRDLEKAESVIKEALKKDPNNIAMVKMLQGVYQQQINLIERVYGSQWQKL